MKTTISRRTPTFMILPSMACQASCTYCFGPHKGHIMDEEAAETTIRFIRHIVEQGEEKQISIIFHGGEPLLAPISVWKMLFSQIRRLLHGYQVQMNLQSNLWALDDELLALLIENQVSIGCSMDGPESICDISRGEGYFAKTFPQVIKCMSRGQRVSAIATISKPTLERVEEICTFFRDEGLPLVLHGAVPSYQAQKNPYSLTPREYSEMIQKLLPWYVANRKRLRITTLDHYIELCANGSTEICTFQQCFGMFLVIDPDGDITSCQRLAGQKEFRLGNIRDFASLEQLYASDAARRQLERERSVPNQCGACAHVGICNGGCYYNALAAGDGIRDYLCEAYQEIFDFIIEQLFEEMQSPENLALLQMAPREIDEHLLLRKGKYISLSKKIHPSYIAENCRHILYASKPDVASEMLPMRATSLNNCYLHITEACNLHCSHCYALAGDKQEELAAQDFEVLVLEALTCGFRQIVITGGEPTIHSQWDRIIDICKENRLCHANLVLRTNLSRHFSEEELRRMAAAFDQIVVSVDGDEASHNQRRGEGNYTSVVKNLHLYVEIAREVEQAAELSLACVQGAKEINGAEGDSVRYLAEELMVSRIRFRPLLPLGRAADSQEPVACEGLYAHESPTEWICRPFNARTTCGIGQNLFVKSNGKAYPCYAWCIPATLLGNVITEGIAPILASSPFIELTKCSVDTIETCRECQYRYVCGGACRAWGNQQAIDLHAAPPNCSHLKKRAMDLIKAASDYLTEE